MKLSGSGHAARTWTWRHGRFDIMSRTSDGGSTFAILDPLALDQNIVRMSTKKALKSIQTKLGRGDQEDALSEATRLLKELEETSPEMSQV